MKSLFQIETLPVLAVAMAAWSSALMSAQELLVARGVLLGFFVG